MRSKKKAGGKLDKLKWSKRRGNSENSSPQPSLVLVNHDHKESGSPIRKRIRIGRSAKGKRACGVFVRKARQASPLTTESDKSSDEAEDGTGTGLNPLLMPEVVAKQRTRLILERVVEFVNNPKDLQSCRQVCSDWREAFSKKASSRATLRCECSLMIHLRYSRVKHAFRAKYPVVPVQSIKISDPIFALGQPAIVDFFEHHGTHIKYLQLEADGWCCVHFHFLEKVLFKWCDNLEHLELHGFEEEKCTGALEASDSEFEKELPALKALHVTGVKNRDGPNLGFIELVFRCATGLQSFAYVGEGGSAFSSSSKNKIGCKKRKRSRKNRGMLWAPSSNIREIRDHARGLTNLDFSGVWLTNSDVEDITAAGWPLKKLVIGGISSADGFVVRDLLESLASTLEHLDIGGGVSCDDDDDDELVMREGRVKFPAMDRLNTLKFRDICTLRAAGTFRFLEQLKNLAHLTLSTQQAKKFQKYLDFNMIFRKGSCPATLKSLCLGGDYGRWDNAKAAKIFGRNINELQLYCDVGVLGNLLEAWRSAGSDDGPLEHLSIELHVPTNMKNATSSFNRSMTKGKGLQDYQLNVLRISTDKPLVLELNTVQLGILLGGTASYYRVEFHGFTVLDRDAGFIASLMTERVNFTRMVNCKVEKPGTLLHSPTTLHLPDVEFGVFNRDDMLERYFHVL